MLDTSLIQVLRLLSRYGVGEIKWIYRVGDGWPDRGVKVKSSEKLLALAEA